MSEPVSIVLKVETLAGERITDACTDALRLAKTLHVMVEFTFNDVSMYVTPGSTIESLCKYYDKTLRRMQRQRKNNT